MPHKKIACPGRIVLGTIRGLVSGLFGGAAVVGGSDILAGKSFEEAWSNVCLETPSIAFTSGVLMFIYKTLECSIESVRDCGDAANSFLAGGMVGAIYGSIYNREQVMTYTVIFSLVCGVLDGLL